MSTVLYGQYPADLVAGEPQGALLEAIRATLEAACAGDFSRGMRAETWSGGLQETARAVQATVELLQGQRRELEEVKQAQTEQAQVLAQVVETFSQSASSLRTTASKLAKVSQRSVHSASEVAESSQRASENIQSIAGATEELAASVQEIERMTQVSLSTTTGAVQSSLQAVDTIQGLCEASRRVDQVVRTISQVAGQTRMLALNANIEAARAGELGRGFSVVASEVKGLALETSQATQKISSQIEDLQASSTEAAQVVEVVGQRLGTLNQFSRDIAEAVAQQKLAAREMSRDTGQAAVHAQAVFNESQKVKEMAEETHQAAESVTLEAEALARQVQVLLAQAEALLGQADHSSLHSQQASDMDFDAAIKAHGAWKLKLSGYLRKPDGSLKADDIETDGRCALGQWLHREGARWSYLPEFARLKAEHARFHKAAGTVVRLADSGHKVSEFTALGGDSEFSQASSSVVKAITAIKARVEADR